MNGMEWHYIQFLRGIGFRTFASHRKFWKIKITPERKQTDLGRGTKIVLQQKIPKI